MWVIAACLSATALAQGFEQTEDAEGYVTPIGPMPEWTAPPETVMPPYDEARARALYRDKCEVCHGARGNGKGPAAIYLDPAPRDLTTGEYKFRSTPTGELPTPADLFRTITRGLRGTSMPGWAGLSEEDRWQLVQRVMAFSPRFAAEKPTRVVVLPMAPVFTDEAVERGRAVYERLGCVLCHGPQGRGDGPSAGQKQEDGTVLRPRTIKRRENLRAGSLPRDVYRTIATGLDGTGMPMFGESASQQELWDVIAYVDAMWTPVVARR